MPQYPQEKWEKKAYCLPMSRFQESSKEQEKESPSEDSSLSREISNQTEDSKSDYNSDSDDSNETDENDSDESTEISTTTEPTITELPTESTTLYTFTTASVRGDNLANNIIFNKKTAKFVNSNKIYKGLDPYKFHGTDKAAESLKLVNKPRSGGKNTASSFSSKDAKAEDKVLKGKLSKAIVDEDPSTGVESQGLDSLSSSQGSDSGILAGDSVEAPTRQAVHQDSDDSSQQDSASSQEDNSPEQSPEEDGTSNSEDSDNNEQSSEEQQATPMPEEDSNSDESNESLESSS
ncbi:dentin sialophosphoprotein-like isoform X1 [Acipenser oxyrinchus oxyrinchus]|uniref:Dentin sialophosphoprotein-like isoform X1 n=1 Tax=Acipenser oxyrinchus oxyrinchus TaxID=40147 RepID=A0AAD8GL10_ACIOX|nr:dentin sialophosphoprotein-like isoform X1 [Acipenser oxyrinchus oxyrinchus]